MQLYKVSAQKTLVSLPPVDPAAAGLKETSDLEAWIQSLDYIFDREGILWISRQERTTDSERADLIGLYEDELVVVELKRGLVEKDAIVQGLSYLSQHSKSERSDLIELFVAQAKKTGKWALRTPSLTEDQARAEFIKALPEETVLNQYRTVVLVGMDFDPETLQVCNLLNDSLGREGNLSIECWRLHIFSKDGEHLCAFDKILPSKDVEDEIEMRRAERKTGKKRDEDRMEWMKQFKKDAAAAGYLFKAKKGQSYQCRWDMPDGSPVVVNIPGDTRFMAPASVATQGFEAVKSSDLKPQLSIDAGQGLITWPQIAWADPKQRALLLSQIIAALQAGFPISASASVAVNAK